MEDIELLVEAVHDLFEVHIHAHGVDIFLLAQVFQEHAAPAPEVEHFGIGFNPVGEPLQIGQPLGGMSVFPITIHSSHTREKNGVR